MAGPQSDDSKAAPRKDRTWALGVLGLLLGGALFFGWKAYNRANDRPAPVVGIPACQSPQAREAVRDAIEANALKNIVSLRLLDMNSVKELKANPAQRLCEATLVLNTGDQPTRFILSFSTIGDLLVTVGDDLDIEAGAAVGGLGTTAAGTQSQDLGAGETIPLAELEGLTDPPTPATVEAVVTRARELCQAQGTDDRPITSDELNEMAGGKIAAFDAAKRRGFALTAADQACYRDAAAFQEEHLAARAEDGEDAEPEAETATQP